MTVSTSTGVVRDALPASSWTGRPGLDAMAAAGVGDGRYRLGNWTLMSPKASRG